MSKRKVIGIDLGSYAVKVLQFRVPKKGHAVLEKTACFPWNGKESKSRPAPKALKNYLHSCSISRGTACSALDDPSLVSRRMSLPGMPAKDMLEVLKFKVRKEMEGSPEEILVDYLPLEKTEAPSGQLMDYMVFALNRKALEAHLRLLEGGGIKPVSVEPAATGLTRLFGICPGLETAQAVLLLDIGFTRTRLILVKGERPVFIREIPFSGRQLTESIQETLDVDAKTAEEWKRQIGVDETAREEPTSRAVADVLRPLVEDLLTEIRFSLGYVQDQIVNPPSVQKIFLTGGGAGMPGLAGALEDAFQLPCGPFPGYEELGLSVSEDFKNYGQQAGPSSLATALGLALREVGG